MSQLSLSPNITTLERPSRWKIWLALSSPVLLLGLAFGYLKYSQQKYLPIVMAVTNVFHARLAGGEDSLIYREADPAWKAALSEDAEQKFFSRIRRKLGACSYSGPLRMFFNANTNGTFVTVVYGAHCTNAAMKETFTWRILDGRRASLMKYRPNSPVLLRD